MIACRLFTVLILLLGMLPHLLANEPADSFKPGGAFGVCNSAEGRGDMAKYMPELRKAGVTIYRGFPEWHSIQPKQGEWHWDKADKEVQIATDNGIEILATFGFLTKWASADGGTRTFPIKDMQYWRDFVKAAVTRYKGKIRYWGVYNEFQGFSKNGTPKDYTKLLVDSYNTAKAIDPNVKIGLATSSVDISFMEQVLKLGGADHFDWIDIHPYELQGAIHNDREYVFLQIMSNIKAMLKKYNKRQDIEVLVGEMGMHLKGKKGEEIVQADLLVKDYVLCFAQGIKKAFWFEARGPYKMGLIRRDKTWSKRPAYHALKHLTSKLGGDPTYLGWLNPTGKSYGFVFDGPGPKGPVLVAWSMTKEGDTMTFDSAVPAVDMMGKAVPSSGTKSIALTKGPVFITSLPDSLVEKAQSNKDKAFPWIKDYRDAQTVSVQMGAANNELGLMLNDKGDGITVLEILKDGSYARRTNRKKRKQYMYFDVDDSYAAAGDHDIEITFTAKAFDPTKKATFNITYESTNKYRDTKEYFNIPKTPGWHTYTFKLKDANFGNTWGWNFRLRALGSKTDIMVRKVEVKRVGDKT